MGHVIVETDAAEVVQAVYSNAFEFSAATNLVDELRSILAFNFISRSVQQRPRACNKVAHELAIVGSVCDPDEEYLLASIPTNIQVVIADDSAPYV